MLVTAILRGIDDDERLGSVLDTAPPLRNLILAYNKHAIAGKNMSVVTANSTGKDLKDAIDKMDPEEQVLLLKVFSSAVEDLDKPIAPVEPMEEKIYNWSSFISYGMPDFMIKAIGIILVVVGCAIMGIGIVKLYNEITVTENH